MDDLTGFVLKISKSQLKDLSEYQVLMGFAGFGNIGFLTLTHLIETMELQSFTYWGNSSWYHRNNLESIVTGYIHEESKTIIITSRVPIFVSTMSKQFWDKLVEDVISWNCRRYIIIGGLREETRRAGSTDWAAFVPTKQWSDLYSHKRTLPEKLTMIGPLSSLLTLGTSANKPVLGLLAYCNLKDDPEASLFALSQINGIAELNAPITETLHGFDYSFLSINSGDSEDYSIGDEGDDMDSFDVEDLL